MIFHVICFFSVVKFIIDSIDWFWILILMRINKQNSVYLVYHSGRNWILIFSLLLQNKWKKLQTSEIKKQDKHTISLSYVVVVVLFYLFLISHFSVRWIFFLLLLQQQQQNMDDDLNENNKKIAVKIIIKSCSEKQTEFNDDNNNINRFDEYTDTHFTWYINRKKESGMRNSTNKYNNNNYDNNDENDP